MRLAPTCAAAYRGDAPAIQVLRSRACGLLTASCLLAVILVGPHARAVDLAWSNSSSTGSLFFNTAANWNPVKTPAAADNVSFSIDVGGNPIIISSNSVALDLLVDSREWAFTGEAGGNLDTGGVARVDRSTDPLAVNPVLTLTNALDWDNAGDFFIGDARQGEVRVLDGSDLRALEFYIGDKVGAIGVLSVNGVGLDNVGSTLTTDGPDAGNGYFIGNAGTGTLNVTGGAKASILNDTTGPIARFRLGIQSTGAGAMNLDGLGSQVVADDVYLGESGSAVVAVTGGAALLQNISAAADAFAATTATGSATVTVSGVGSRWEMDRLELGAAGAAALSVSDGAAVQSHSNDVVLGVAAGSSGHAAVVGAGANLSNFIVARDLFVGAAGAGEFRAGIGTAADISSSPVGPGRATVNVAGDLRIGSSAGNNNPNLAYVTGPSTTVTIGDVLYVGENGNGKMVLNGGAKVVSARPRVGSGANADGVLEISGAGTEFYATVDMVVATGGNGTATVSDGALVNTNLLAVGYQNASHGTLVVDNATLVAGANNVSDLMIGGASVGGVAGGNGAVTVRNGGTLRSNVQTFIGGNATGTGSLLVTGAGSLFDNDDNSAGQASNDILNVGHFGAGTAQVLSGGRIEAEGIKIGSVNNANNASLTVRGSEGVARSLVDAGGYLYVGDQRRGTMTVDQGAQVKVARNATGERLIVGNGAAADGSMLTINGANAAGTRLDYLGSAAIAIGGAGDASLSVVSGGVLSAFHYDSESGTFTNQARLNVGESSGSHGIITVNGDDSLVEVGSLFVGNGESNSSGIIEILAGGKVHVLGATEVGAAGAAQGRITVNGNGSSFQGDGSLSLGDDIFNAGGFNGAQGTLEVSAGGFVSTSGAAYVGRYTGSVGTATVGPSTGLTSSWGVSGELTIGGDATTAQTSGSGTVNVEAGAILSLGSNLRIRNLGKLNLNGGQLFVQGDFLFPDSGGTFNFASGSIHSTRPGGLVLNDALLGRFFAGGPTTLGAGQVLEIDGPASFGPVAAPLRINGGSLVVGSISVADFAHVDFDAGAFALKNSDFAVGDGGLFGSTAVLGPTQAMYVYQQTTVAPGASLNVIGGDFTTGSATNDGLIVLSQTANVNFDSDGDGSGLVNNGRLVLINAAAFGAVSGGGSIDIVGAAAVSSLSLSSGASIDFDLAGKNPGQFDTLAVDGPATLAGTLTVGLAPGYIPTLGDSFELIAADSLVNNGVTLAGAAGFSLVTTPTSLRVQFGGGLPGDFDLDGDVDGGDFLAWQRGQSPNPNSTGDLQHWRDNFGANGSVAANGSVPEPRAICMTVLAAVAIGSLRPAGRDS